MTNPDGTLVDHEDPAIHKLQEITAEEKFRWLKALRSGKYRQTEGRLCKTAPRDTDPSYCCLGVLADIQGELKYDPLSHARRFLGMAGTWLYKSWDGAVPETAYLSRPMQQHLGHLNDHGWDFKAIADWIEQNVRVKQ